MLQKQGEIDADGAPVRSRNAFRRVTPGTHQPRTVLARSGPSSEVAWPTREETINYSIVVLITIIILGAMIYGLDWLFSTFILEPSTTTEFHDRRHHHRTRGRRRGVRR